jgi:hypothetical protein
VVNQLGDNTPAVAEACLTKLVRVVNIYVDAIRARSVQSLSILKQWLVLSLIDFTERLARTTHSRWQIWTQGGP